MPELRVHGQREPDSSRGASALEHALPKGVLTVKHSVRVGFARDGHAPTTLDAVASDDVVEMELDGGLRLWSRVDDLQSDFGLKASRDASGTDTLEISTQLPLGGQSRGAGDWVLRGLKVLGVDIAGEIADFVADKVEGQLSPAPGLYRCSPARVGDLSTPRKLKGDRPTLVFLHGTGSSTEGSFGELWKGGGSRMSDLARIYGNNLLALQHRTLTQSPIENARDLLAALARVLPTGSELHLVSHSRGGLIGELVARGNRIGGGSFDQTDLRLFSGADRAREAAALRELRDLLEDRRYVVSRFVRVACPARGTTLADGRLDRYLSVILNVLEAIPGVRETRVFDTFASLLAAVVKKRTDPRELPGLEAMMPGSPLVRLLNRPDVRTDANLRILGGDIEGTGFWGRLKAFVTDLYYREDHDLVVNTPAMFGGTERSKTVRYWIDTGGRVNHFSYFSNADTAGRLVAALANEAAPEFHDVTVPLGAVTEDDYRKRAPVAQPVVFVLPGEMGSNLAADGNRVWLDRLGLARGAMEDLRAGAPRVRAESLVDGSYRDLVRHLAASHEVVPFPYDWRRPLADSATALRKAIDAKLDALEGADQPIRLLAHSMGGLVVRAMLATADGQATWKRMCRHPGARFVMLGTPNGGSHAIGAMLMGRDPLVKQLALLDLRHTYSELLAIVAEYDGALQLLPHAGTLDLYDPAVWKRLHQHDAKVDRGILGARPVDPSKSANVDWSLPASARLAGARATRDVLRTSPLDPNRMIYVAGVADQTACDIRIDEEAPVGRRVAVLGTSRGDGRVPWATGIPPELAGQTYYMNAVHGDLANTDESFPAIVDLLATGTTSKLSRTPPAVRGDSTDTFPLREADVDAFPDDASLTAAALGGRRGRKARRLQERTRVRVVHDNLVWSRWPVVVGHYRDDVFVGAESFMDKQLDGRLRELHRLDLYPGAYNTAAVVLNEPGVGAVAQLPGAIVVGLGTVGELAPGALASTLTHALTMYGAEAIGRERQRRRDGILQSEALELRLGITALLVGAGAGGVRLADSIQAILRAVQRANARFEATRSGTPETTPRGDGATPLTARIVSVDLFELFEDRAIQAVRELQALSRISDFRSDFVVEEVLAPGKDGERRATFDDLPGWWQRLRIARQPGGELRFEALTTRARVEASLLPTQQLMVRGLLERASRSTATDLDLSATLYELLLPRGLKEQAPDRRPLVLVVDDTSAMLPWELMHDRWSAGARPLSVDTGMVRQFVASDFRRRVHRAPNDTALVIGDPPLEGSPMFMQLPGAAAEAGAVAAALRENGFETTALIGMNAQWPDVLASLYGHAYRVLHIAAHGVHEFEPQKGAQRVTGVVLGDGAFLTPAEFEQLRVVPDLVFINCCHLGRDGEYGRTTAVAFPQLAANVAQQLIRMGVRAVVAAGWAVDDQAAKEFARRFYGEMLAGREFGQAVLVARQEIFSRFGAANTWGAYQCYGDPGFLLRPAAGVGDADSFVAERELQDAVRTLAGRVRGDTKRRAELSQRLERMVATAPTAWLKSGATCAVIASAYGELEQLNEAVKYYDRALVAEPATASLESVEKLANLLAKLAARQAKPALDVMGRSTRLLQNLAALGKTGERLSLLGATCKRRALKASGRVRLQAVAEMIKAYKDGYEVALKNQSANPWYPLGNLVAGKVVMSWQPSARKGAALDVAGDMKALRGYGKTVPASSTDFWELCLPADVMLLEAALQGTLSAKDRKTLEAAYRTAAERAGTPREIGSATDQIAFLRDMARSSRSKPIQALAASLDELFQALTQEAGTSARVRAPSR